MSQWDFHPSTLLLLPIVPATYVATLTSFDIGSGTAGLVLTASSLTNTTAIWNMIRGVLGIRVAFGVPAWLSPIIMFGPPVLITPLAVIAARTEFPTWLILLWNIAGMYFVFAAVWLLVLVVLFAFIPQGESSAQASENDESGVLMPGNYPRNDASSRSHGGHSGA